MKMNLPNILTLSRIFCIPIIIVVCFIPMQYQYTILTMICAMAFITDFLDGYLARRCNDFSEFGRIMDPIADKVIVAVILIILIQHQILKDFHVIAALLIVMREIVVSGIREALAENKVKVSVSLLAKWKTGIQMVALLVLLISPEIQEQHYIHQLGIILLWIAVLLTLKTGYDYIYKFFGYLKD